MRISPASAAVVTYTFGPGTSFTFADGGTGDLTGTFTIDPPGFSLSGSNIVVTGGQEAGTYTPGFNDNGEALTYFTGVASLRFSFTQNLNSAPEHATLSGVAWISGGVSSPSMTVTGGATLSSAPIPEPSTWAMMLLGFAGLALVGYRQTRRGSGRMTRRWRAARAL